MDKRVQELFALASEYMSEENTEVKTQKTNKFVAKFAGIFPVEKDLKGELLEQANEFCKEVEKTLTNSSSNDSSKKAQLAFLKIFYSSKERINKNLHKKLCATIGTYLFSKNDQYAILFLDNSAAEDVIAQKRRAVCLAQLMGFNDMTTDSLVDVGSLWSNHRNEFMQAQIKMRLLELKFYCRYWSCSVYYAVTVDKICNDFSRFSRDVIVEMVGASNTNKKIVLVRELFILANQYAEKKNPSLKSEKMGDFIEKFSEAFPLKKNLEKAEIDEFCSIIQEILLNDDSKFFSGKIKFSFAQLVYRAKQQINKDLYVKLSAIIGSYLFSRKNKCAILFLESAVAEDGIAQQQRSACCAHWRDFGVDVTSSLDRAQSSSAGEERIIKLPLVLQLLELELFDSYWHFSKDYSRTIESIFNHFAQVSREGLCNEHAVFMDKYLKNNARIILLKELFVLAQQYAAVDDLAKNVSIASEKDSTKKTSMAAENSFVKKTIMKSFIQKFGYTFPVQKNPEKEEVDEFCRHVEEILINNNSEVLSEKNKLYFLWLIYSAKKQINERVNDKLCATIGKYLFVQKKSYAILFLQDAPEDDEVARNNYSVCKADLTVDVGSYFTALKLDDKRPENSIVASIEMRLELFGSEWYLDRRHFVLVESIFEEYPNLSVDIFFLTVINFTEKYQFSYERQAKAESDSNKRNSYLCQAGIVAATLYKFLRMLIKKQESSLSQAEKDKFVEVVNIFFDVRKKYYQAQISKPENSSFKTHYETQRDLAASTAQEFLSLLQAIFDSPLNAVNDPDPEIAGRFKTNPKTQALDKTPAVAASPVAVSQPVPIHSASATHFSGMSLPARAVQSQSPLNADLFASSLSVPRGVVFNRFKTSVAAATTSMSFHPLPRSSAPRASAPALLSTSNADLSRASYLRSSSSTGVPEGERAPSVPVLSTTNAEDLFATSHSTSTATSSAPAQTSNANHTQDKITEFFSDLFDGPIL